MKHTPIATIPLLLLLLLPAWPDAQERNLGVFTSAGDVGAPAIKGNTEFTPTSREYRMTGAGANMWAAQDQFQFAWREMTGNFTINATMRFLGEGNEHRKAGLMVRQSLDSDASYGDVVVHGNGMAGLQWRPRKGESTNTFNLPIEGPGTFAIRLVRTGVRLYLFLGRNGAPVKEVAHTEVSFQNGGPVGLFVCSHDAGKSDTVVFSDVSVEPQAPAAPGIP